MKYLLITLFIPTIAFCQFEGWTTEELSQRQSYVNQIHSGPSLVGRNETPEERLLNEAEHRDRAARRASDYYFEVEK